MIKSNIHTDFYLVGISNHPVPQFSDEVLLLLQESSVFSGGKRHYELVKTFLPENHVWIEISGKMPLLMEKYQTITSSIVVIVSGDPFFYGFGNTLQRMLPKATLKAFPYFNSIQRLCHKTQTNYNDLTAVSVHGRDWSALDHALIRGEALIGILTDTKKTPATIAKRMLKYNFNNYTITIGEALDGNTECIEQMSLQDCSTIEHQALNCVLLKRATIKKRAFGISDTDFIHLENRSNMITKMPIRLSTINALELQQKSVFWDIGTCTGSVAIEAKQQFPHLQVIAFEKRESCRDLLQKNTEQFSTPGIDIIINDFFNLDLETYPVPEVVFIGGHGGRLKEMIHKIHLLNSDVQFVTNAVRESSSNTFIEELSTLKYRTSTNTIQLNNHNSIRIHSAKK